MVIWMDGRPEPSNFRAHARRFHHRQMEGNGTLVARTTHMKAGFREERSAEQRSDDDDVTLLPSRRHHDGARGDRDPIYLAEPHHHQELPAFAHAISPIGPPCVSTFEGRPLDESVPRTSCPRRIRSSTS